MASNTHTYYLAILIFVGVSSCNLKDEAKVSKSILVNVDAITPSDFSTYLKRTKLVPLEDRNESFLSDELSAKFDHKTMDIYVWDYSQKIIMRYDSAGSFINEVGVIGHGPGEITSINDFDVSNGMIEIITPGSSLVMYDSSGKFIDRREIKVNNYSPTSFSSVGDGEYLFYLSYGNYPFRLYHTNEKGEVMNSLIEATGGKKLLPMVRERNFFRHDNTLYFKEAFQSSIVEFKNPKLDTIVKFQFGDFNVPAEFWEMGFGEGLKFLSGHGYANIRGMAINDNYVLADIEYQKRGSERSIVRILINRSTGEVIRSDHSSYKDLNFEYPLYITDNDELVFITFRRLNNVSDYSNYNPELIYYKLTFSPR